MRCLCISVQKPLFGRLVGRQPHRRPMTHIQTGKWVFHIQGTLVTSKESFCGLARSGLREEAAWICGCQQRPSQGRSPWQGPSGELLSLALVLRVVGPEVGARIRPCLRPVSYAEKSSEGWQQFRKRRGWIFLKFLI